MSPAPELSVVCRSCGSEVSPYVTECPYCGHRLRKRAPQLEREGDEIRVRESRRDKRRRLRRERAGDGNRALELDSKPLATAGTLLIGAVLIVLGRSVPLNLSQLGAVGESVGSEAWRYVTAPFVYNDLGAYFVIGLAIWVFGCAVEARLGSLATGTLILATGTLGMIAAVASTSAGMFEFAAGGNGVALGLLGAWLMLWRGESKHQFSEPLEAIGVTVVAVVLLLLPLVDFGADPVAGLTGGVVGLAMGSLAARRAESTSD